MPDSITSYLQTANLPQQAKADAWEAAQAGDKDTFTKNVGSLQIPRNVKADLYEAKFGNATPTRGDLPPGGSAPAQPAPGIFDRIGSAIKDEYNDIGGFSGVLHSMITGEPQSKTVSDVQQNILQQGAATPGPNQQFYQGIANVNAAAAKPLVHVSDRPGFQKVFDPNSQSLVSRAITGSAKMLEGLTTPSNIEAGALLPFSGGAGTIAGANFALEGAGGAADLGLQTAGDLYKGDKGAAAEHGVQALLNAAMAGSMVAHGGEAAKPGTVDGAPTQVVEPTAAPQNPANLRDVLEQNQGAPTTSIQPPAKYRIPSGTGLGSDGTAGVVSRVKGLLPAPADADLSYNGETTPQTAEAPPMSPEAEAVSAQAAASTPGDNSPLVRTLTRGGQKYQVAIPDEHDANALQLASKKSVTAQQPHLDALQAAFPDLSEQDFRDHGDAVRSAVKDAVSAAQPGDDITLPSMSDRLTRGDLPPGEGLSTPELEPQATPEPEQPINPQIAEPEKPEDVPAQPTPEAEPQPLDSASQSTPGDNSPLKGKQPKAAADLEDALRPQIGQVMRLSQLLQGDQTASVLKRGLEATNDLESAPLTDEERQIASAALGTPVRSAFTPDQVTQARQLLGRSKSEGPKPSKLGQKIKAETLPRIAETRQRVAGLIADPNFDPEEKEKLQRMMSETYKDGRPLNFLYEPKDETAGPTEIGKNHPEGPFTKHAFGQDVPEISLKNVSAATGKLARTGRNERTVDMGLGNPELKAQIEKYAADSKAYGEEIDKEIARKKQQAAEGTVNENTKGMDYAGLKHSTDRLLKSMKDEHDRGAVKEKISRVMVDLRKDLDAYKGVRDPKKNSDLVKQLNALPATAFQHLPKEIQELAKGTRSDAPSEAKATADEKPVQAANASEKTASVATPARRTAVTAATQEVERIKATHPEATKNIPTIYQKAVEHFGGDTAGRTNAIAQALIRYRKALDAGDAYALKAPIRYISQRTPEEGSGGTTLYSGIDPTKVVPALKAGYKLINPRLTEGDVSNISTDALHNILTRYEKMTPIERSAFGERIWGSDLDRLAVAADPKEGLDKRLEDLRKTIPPSSNILTRLNDVFTRHPDADSFKSALRTIRGETRLRELQFKAQLEKYDREAAGWGAGVATRFFDNMEHGADQGSPFQNEMSAALRSFLDTQRERANGMRPDVLAQYIENYFPHIWSNVGKARNLFGGVGKSLTGDQSFLKARDHQLFIHGLQNGLQPVTWNPVRLAIIRGSQIEQFVMKEKVLQMMDAKGWRTLVNDGDAAPAGMTQLVDRSNQAGAGKYYAPDAVANVFNKAFRPSVLQDSASYEVARQFNAVSTMLQLGVSFVHASTISRQTIASELTRAGVALQAGRFGDVVKHSFNSAAFPKLLVDNYKLGRELSNALKDPAHHLEYASFADNFAKGNLNLGKDPLVTAHFADMLNSSWNVVKDETFATSKRVGNVPVAAYAALGRIFEKTSEPVMEHYVPNMKIAAFYKASLDAIQDHTGTSEELDRKIQAIADNYDDHMGEVATDNLWWSKTNRDIASLLFLAKGWTYGNLRMYAGGTVDLAKTVNDARQGKGFQLTHRSLYAGTSLATLALTNALYQTVLPGAPPVQGLDYLYPRDGTKDRYGKWNRINPLAPEYDPISYYRAPIDTLTHKASPALATVAELYQNKDYYNHQIVDPSDGALKAGAKRLGYVVAKDSLPLTVANAIEGTKRGQGGVGAFVQSQLGFHPSQKFVGQSDAEQLAATYYHQQQADAPMDDDQFEKNQLATQTRAEYQSGKIDLNEVAKRVNSGQLPAKFIQKLTTPQTQTALQFQTERIMQTAPEQALKVLQRATPEEREQLKPVLIKHLGKVDPQYLQAFADEINK